LRSKHNGFAIALAWPETLCKQAGAWYDNLMHFMGINDKGYYKVGHAAIVLIDDETGICHYFDFGRYHAPQGNGRVRSAITDHDLKIQTKAIIEKQTLEIVNLDEILFEIFGNPSTHGDGTIYGSPVRINFNKGYRYVLDLQKRDFIPYGPFISNGTNCSRFVNGVLQNGDLSILKNLLLKLPWMITPTPLWNLSAAQGGIKKIGNFAVQSEEIYTTHTTEMIFNP